MNHRGGIAFLFLALAASLAAPPAVKACVCADADDTVLGKFEEARFVLIAEAVSVEKIPEVKTSYSGGEEIKHTEAAVKSIKMAVEKVYKGELKAGDEIIIGQGESGSCFQSFDEDDVGTKFLFYLKPRERSPAVWYAEGCGRSKPLPHFVTNQVGDAADDLLYLEKMGEARGKTRLSGTLTSYQWSPAHGSADFRKMAGRRVRVVGEQGSYEAETNEDGVYEIYGLPPGRYTVDPETPQGWKIETRSGWGGGGSGGAGDGPPFSVNVGPGRHAYFDFFYRVDTRVRGRVLDPSGRPMGDVCVDLLPARGEVSKYFKRVDCTTEDGSFEIDEVPFGSYVAVVNKDDKISPAEPFRKFYYPNVYEREAAAVITISEGAVERAIELHIPEMKEVVTVEGVFLSSDGKPVVRGAIYFKAEKTDEGTAGEAFAATGADGKFSIKILKGMKGELLGSVILDESDYKGCPHVVELLRRKAGPDRRGERTGAVTIDTRNDVAPVELKLSFASCGGAKIVSRIRID